MNNNTETKLFEKTFEEKILDVRIVHKDIFLICQNLIYSIPKNSIINYENEINLKKVLLIDSLKIDDKYTKSSHSQIGKNNKIFVIIMNLLLIRILF